MPCSGTTWRPFLLPGRDPRPGGDPPRLSSFQVQIADFDILTAGDSPDCLVAMNPAALKKNLKDLRQGGTLIVNTDAFDERNLAKAGYEGDPLEDGTLDGYRVIKVPMDDLTKEAVKDTGVSGRSVLRSRTSSPSACSPGCSTDPPSRPSIGAEEVLPHPRGGCCQRRRISGRVHFGEATRQQRSHSRSSPPRCARHLHQRQWQHRTRLGLIAASKLSGLPLFCGTIRSLRHRTSSTSWRVTRTSGAHLPGRDEIAGVGVPSAPPSPGLAVTGSSGPGIALKSEAISLAFMMELPHRHQRPAGGPSTGLPTKPEQSDLLFSLYGRHGESPIPVLAIASPSDAFELTIEAARIAIKYMTPVLLLSDNQVANGSEPWMLPDVNALAPIEVEFAKHPNGPNGTFLPYMRDIDTFARPWAVPGTPGWSTGSVAWKRRRSPGTCPMPPTTSS